MQSHHMRGRGVGGECRCLPLDHICYMADGEANGHKRESGHLRRGKVTRGKVGTCEEAKCAPALLHGCPWHCVRVFVRTDGSQDHRQHRYRNVWEFGDSCVHETLFRGNRFRSQQYIWRVGEPVNKDKSPLMRAAAQRDGKGGVRAPQPDSTKPYDCIKGGEHCTFLILS